MWCVRCVWCVRCMVCEVCGVRCGTWCLVREVRLCEVWPKPHSCP